MKNKSTPLVEEYLQSLQGMQQVDTDDFFFTRLKAKMEKNAAGDGWNFPLRLYPAIYLAYYKTPGCDSFLPETGKQVRCPVLADV